MNEFLATKITRIFEGIMGCKLEFQSVETLSKDLWKSEDIQALKSKLSEPPSYLTGEATGCFGFPVNLNGSFAGLAVVRAWEGAKPTKLLLLAELLTLVMESGLNLEDKRDQLRTLEERLQVLSGKHSNVIPLRKSARVRHELKSEYDFIADVDSNVEVEVDLDLDFNSDVGLDFDLDANLVSSLPSVDTAPVQNPPSPLTTMPLLIETEESFPLHRIAIEIHHLSRRWAFVSIDDLPSEIFSSKETLQQLGAVTLFIPNLATLTTNQQLKLAEYLAIKPSAEMPQVVAGVVEPIEQLKEQRRVMPHLIELFCSSKLTWTHRSPEQINSDVINASLRQLMEQTRETHKIGNHFIPFHIQYFDPNRPSVH